MQNITTEYLKTLTIDELTKLKNDYKMLADKEDLQQFVFKILINSFYGAASMSTATFSHGKGYAAAVTAISRFTNRWVAYTVSKKIAKMLKLNFTEEELDHIPMLIQADTDSNYLSLAEVIKLKFKDKLAETPEKIAFGLKFLDKYVEGFIQDAIDEVNYTINGYNKDVMVMEQETSSDKFISVADKRYFCRKWYQDYNKEWKTGHKMTGISLVSKSTPKWFKEKLKPVLDIIIDNDSVILLDYIDKIQTEMKSVTNIEDVCVIKGVGSVDYELKPDNKANRIKDGKILSAPLHSRGAIIHNKMIAGNNKYKEIMGGDKVYYCYLRTPNKAFNQNVVSFANPQFMYDYDLIKSVDWDVMFEKNFKQNVQNITDKIKWSLDKYQAMMDEWS